QDDEEEDRQGIRGKALGPSGKDRHGWDGQHERDDSEQKFVEPAKPVQFTVSTADILRRPDRCKGRVHVPAVCGGGLRDVTPELEQNVIPHLRFHPGHRPSYLDRKSTRLNSSHVSISYAVF